MGSTAAKYRVEAFTGDVETVEAKLNAVAAEGWVLVTATHNSRLGCIIWIFQREA